MLPTATLLILVSACVAAPLLAPHSPTVGLLSDRLMPPAWVAGGSAEFLLGTDPLGRDVLSRLLFGGRVSLAVSFAAVAIGGAVGTTLGLVAGYTGRWLDEATMRFADIAAALPTILIGLLSASLSGPGVGSSIVVLSFLVWPRFTRQVRAEVLVRRGVEYVLAAHALGAPTRHVLLRHILPNIAPSIVVLATLQVGAVMLLEAALSFLGSGIPAPFPAWGVMVAQGRSLVGSAFWVSFFPGAAILLTVLCVNNLGDWARAALDPRAAPSWRTP